jgi:23S rRNA (guanosine2251-2'-O)-methyltransferase
MTERAPRGSRRRDAGVDRLGGEQVEGRRAVRELLRARRRRVRTVFLSGAVQRDALVDEIAELAGSALRIVDPQRLSTIATTDVHQGVVARADALVSADLDTLIEEPEAFLVALDSVTDPRNLGAVLRAAETAGSTGVVLPRHRAARITPAVAKSAAGAIEHVPISLVSGIPSALDRAKRAGVWSIGLDEEGDRSVFELELATEPILLVFGAEGRGLGRLTRERCDLLVSIPMAGHIESLNVAGAAAVACHEVARRRAMEHASRPR